MQSPVWRKESQKWPLTEVDTHTMDVLKPLLMQLGKMGFSSEISVVVLSLKIFSLLWNLVMEERISLCVCDLFFLERLLFVFLRMTKLAADSRQAHIFGMMALKANAEVVCLHDAVSYVSILIG